MNNGPSQKPSGSNPRGLTFSEDWRAIVAQSRRSQYAEFRRLWDEAGKRNRERANYTEDHGEGWWISEDESRALALQLRAARIAEHFRVAFVREYAPHLEVWHVGADGVPVRVSAPRRRFSAS